MDFTLVQSLNEKFQRLFFFLIGSYNFVILSILAWIAYLSLVNFRLCWRWGLFFVPLSLTLDFDTVSITIPSDLLALFLMGVVILRFPMWRQDFLKMFSHPILLSFLLYYAWMGVTIFTSELPIVSLKFFLNTSWYFWGFCIFSILLFRQENELDNWIKYLILPLSIVILWTLAKHAQTGFSHGTSYRIMQPFYKEHTAYAASLTFFFFFFLYQFLTTYKKQGIFFNLSFYMVFLLLVALIFSYTRGAWIGTIGGIFMMLVLTLWKRWRQVILLIGSGIGIILLINFSNFLFFTGKQSQGQSDRRRNLFEHLQSITNLSTDLSNLERINRWVAAINMINDKPLTGTGPGTFAMVYSGYQLSQFRTYISTNLGNQGTAHSEYFLAASEMGIPGLLFFLLFLFSSLYYAAKGFLNAQNPRYKYLYLTAFGTLSAYYIHAIVNNFLDQDKIAIPFYVTIALIVALDIYYNISQTREQRLSKKKNSEPT